jgi:hypothetical protein
MAFILFLLGLAGFAFWLFRQPLNSQITSVAVFCGAMFLYGSFAPSLLGLHSSYGATVVFFISILTSVGLRKLKTAQGQDPSK